ncbi:hypothetical protein FACS1894130_01200 [Spirochaetia bacterium]|nr:hypothetical protein FACS1894130_01200 [Spirochaetia bacterium]
MKYQSYHLTPRLLAGLFLCAAFVCVRPLPLAAEPAAADTAKPVADAVSDAETTVEIGPTAAITTTTASGAETDHPAEPANFPKWTGLPSWLNLSVAFLGTGSWDMDGSLISREDLRLVSRRLTGQGLNVLDFTGRFQVIDKRPGLFWEGWEAGNTAFSGGLYHDLTGSRLLGGILDEWGLSARLRNPWGKSLPFAEAHKPSMADLKTEPSSTREPEAYLYVGSPRLGRFRSYASAQVSATLSPSFGMGLDTLLSKKNSLRAEGFYTRRHLSERAPKAWFSEIPRLPERDFHLYGVGLFFTSPFVGAAADGAYSETFAWGQDLYGNLAVRLGDKPWKLNLGIEAAGERFVDRDGSNAGAGFRTAAQFEWKWKRSSFIRASTRLHAPATGESFDRSNTVIYYHFPSNLKTNWALPLQPVKISITTARDARNREKILDTVAADVGFNVGPVQAALQTTLSGIADSDDAATDQAPIPYPGASSYSFNSAKVSGNVSWSIGMFQFKAKLGYLDTKTRDPVWDTYLSAAIRVKPGRFTVKVSSPDFPERWSCSLSWRVEGKTAR